MASLIPSSGVIYNAADTAPPPCKDYCQIIVTWDKVVFRLWKIALRNDVKPSPSEVKDDYEDFLLDDRLHSEIQRCFGKNTLNYLKELAAGHIDFLPRLPRHLLINILRYLNLEDLSRVSTLSKMFKEICNSDDLWAKLYEDHIGKHNITEELSSLAEAVGWKKLFFTNKLQLQMQLRRLNQQRGTCKEDENMDDPSEISNQDQYDNQVCIALNGDNIDITDETGYPIRGELEEIYRRSNTDIFDEEFSEDGSSVVESVVESVATVETVVE